MNDANASTIKLIVGLGNPGAEYAGTRHNAGFMVLDRVMKSLEHAEFDEKHLFESRVFTGKCRGKALICQMPLTYMNLSGKAVAPLCRKQGIAPEEVLVIHDDLDLPLGKLRLRQGGSSGGHNGIKSLIEELGSEKFLRVRVGIGRPDTRTADYVLGAFSQAEAAVWAQVEEGACSAVNCILKSGMSRAMNQYNSWAPAGTDDKE